MMKLIRYMLVVPIAATIAIWIGTSFYAVSYVNPHFAFWAGDGGVKLTSESEIVQRMMFEYPGWSTFDADDADYLPTPRAGEINFPFWAVFLIIAFFWIDLRLLERRRARIRVYEQCGHDLPKSDCGVCLECGANVQSRTDSQVAN